MKVKCPGCEAVYSVDDSKIPDKGIYGRCPKCQQRFLIKKESDAENILLEETPTPEKFAKEYLNQYAETHTQAKMPTKPPTPLNHFFNSIQQDKKKAVLFITAGVLALMLLFPPFHAVVKGNDLRLGYAFLTSPPTKYGNYVKVDAVMLMVQCLVVTVIGMIFWLALRKDRPSSTYREVSYEKRQTRSGPIAKETLGQIPANSFQSVTISQSSQQVTDKDFIDFIGVNADKYLRKFRRLESGGSSITWHWPVVFASAWWMLYRKLYAWAVALFIFGVIVLYFPAVVSLSVGLPLIILLGIFANYIYYKHTRKKILAIKSKATSSDSLALSAALQKTGGVHRWVPVLIVILSILALVGIGAALWIPQFAADRQGSTTVQKPSERYDGQVTPEPKRPTEEELSQQRMADYENEYQNILKKNPDRDPYVLEEGMKVLREAPIAPMNYPTVDDLEKFGRERIAKKAQRQAKRSSGECVSGNCKDGQGTFIHANGDKYVGQFRNYKYHIGTYFFQNGEIYEGIWKGGEFYEGAKTFPNGEQYWGKWKGFRPNGRGVYVWPNGLKYEGDFSEGRLHGQGKLTYPDGSYELGEWKNGMAAGVIKVQPNSE